MLHLIGKTLTVLATIGVVAKIAELEAESEAEQRRRQLEKSSRRAEKISKRELEIQQKKALEAVIKRREKKEAEIKRILYGIPVEAPVTVKKRSWWQLGKVSSDSELQRPVFFEDKAELKAQENFRARHPFTSVKVPSRYMEDFVKEFDWLQSKTGKIPSTVDQQAILIGLIRNS
jgi:hypothetical protein